MSKEYELLVNHKSDLLSQDLILTGIYQFSDFKHFGLSFDFPYVIYNHKNGDISWLKKHLDEIRNNLLPKEEYKKLISELKKNLEDYTNYLKRFKDQLHLARNNPKIIIKFFDQSIKAAGSISKHILELPIGLELEKSGIPLKEIKSAKTETTRASEELKRIAKEFSEELSGEEISDELSDRLDYFCKKYGYLGMKYFLGRPWNKSDACEMLKEITDYSEKQEITDIRKYDSPYLEFAEGILRLRTEKWESMCYGTYLFREMILSYFSDMVSYDDLLELRMDEVISVLSGNKVSKREYNGDETIILKVSEKGVELVTDKAEERDSANFNLEEISEIKGQCACAGKVIGKVKVVLEPNQCSKIEKGDILVATMSTPDFLFGMVKAAAFITDIGGMTCHAAIVAREMNKPCVIGTEIATKVFKDGDLIEVDAEKGIVRKIR